MESRQVICFVLCTLAYIFGGMEHSMIAPFFPEVAEQKGVSSFEYGAVFAVYELMVLISSPIFGSWIGVLTPRLTFVFGLTVSAVGCILFGSLEEVTNPILFLTFSLLIRACEAVGGAAYFVTVATIIPVQYPEAASTAMSALDVMAGFGGFVGPLLGGFLYQSGGYHFPFLVIGTALLLTGIGVYFTMPDMSVCNLPKEEECTSPEASFWSIFNLPGNAAIVGSLIIATSASGFIEVSLEPHLRSFQLQKSQLGSLFVVEGVVFSITAPLVGALCDRRKISPNSALLGGLFIIVVSGLLIGPAPFIPLKSNIGLIVIALFLQGIGVGSVYSGSFAGLSESTMNMPSSVSTAGIISGIWLSGQSLGVCLGNLLSGLLGALFTARESTVYIAISAFLMVLALLISTTKIKRKQHELGDYHLVQEQEVDSDKI